MLAVCTSQKYVKWPIRIENALKSDRKKYPLFPFNFDTVKCTIPTGHRYSGFFKYITFGILIS